MWLPVLAVVAGLAVLVWSADKFIDGAAAVARHFALPPLLIGVVIVGAGVMLTGWTLLDPIASLVIVAVILFGTWGLLRDSVDLALDAAPASVEVPAVRATLEALPGVSRVHDLHVWALSTTRTALTAHLVHERADADALLREAQAVARDFGVAHATLQLETAEGPDCPGC